MRVETEWDEPKIKWAALSLNQGDRPTLARLLTLAESSRADHRAVVDRVLEKAPSREGFRIAVTGAPGVGKSTLLEALGVHLVDGGHRVAALTIDPSSPVSGGSILGDKTRMPRLSSREGAFVRPIPAGTSVGGVSGQSARCVRLCEVAGFDVVFVETVGVGQSELAAFSLVDVFLLLVQPLAGDEMQGIKRGLMEHVDVLAVSKSEPHPRDAEKTRLDYEAALSLLHETPPTCLAIDSRVGTGIPQLWDALEGARIRTASSQTRVTRRRLHARQGMWRTVAEVLIRRLENQAQQEPDGRLSAIIQRCDRGEVSPEQAAHELLGFLAQDPQPFD